MTAAAQLQHVYRYPFASHVEHGYGLRLATSGAHDDAAANPYFFEGRVARPDELSDMLLVLSEVVRARFYLPGAMRELDPVVTCSEAALRFEGFSSCCGVYGRADFAGGAFDGALHARGTTNVDFNSRLRQGRGPRTEDGAHLARSHPNRRFHGNGRRHARRHRRSRRSAGGRARSRRLQPFRPEPSLRLSRPDSRASSAILRCSE